MQTRQIKLILRAIEYGFCAGLAALLFHWIWYQFELILVAVRLGQMHGG